MPLTWGSVKNPSRFHGAVLPATESQLPSSKETKLSKILATSLYLGYYSQSIIFDFK